MSLYDYKESLRLGVEDPPFYALIMAAMRKADGNNILKLEVTFPGTFAELKRRYDCPGGVLPEEEEKPST